MDAVIADLKIPDSVVEQLIPSGQSRVRNQIQWVRFYLTKAGLMDSPKSGVWRLGKEIVDLTAILMMVKKSNQWQVNGEAYPASNTGGSGYPQ